MSSEDPQRSSDSPSTSSRQKRKSLRTRSHRGKPRKPRGRRSSKKPRRDRSPNPHRRTVLGATYLITKKCSEDLFLIRPEEVINQILLYLLILKALRYQVVIHGFCFMDNHFHLIVTDVIGQLPAFMREVLGETSKAIQAATEIDQPIWSRRRYSYTNLLDLDAAERFLVYTILNPTLAGLTLPGEWPGLTTANMKPGDVLVATRPSVYFSTRRPAVVAIPLVAVAEAFGECTHKSEARIEEQTALGVRICVDALATAGRTFAGADRVRRNSFFKRGNRTRGGMTPRFATRNSALLQAAIVDFIRFETDHETAKRRYIDGDYDVSFPVGTYGYKELLLVRVGNEEAVA